MDQSSGKAVLELFRGEESTLGLAEARGLATSRRRKRKEEKEDRRASTSSKQT